jgi:hypothetical protein
MKKSYLLLILLVTSVETYYSQKEKTLNTLFLKFLIGKAQLKKLPQKTNSLWWICQLNGAVPAK